MPNAFATTAQLTCDGCGQPFSADLWLIVDTVERPDLLARLRAQTLHDVPCPHCNRPTTLDVPLLVFRPDGRPVLTFLPRWQSDAAQTRQDARQLLTLLQANLGAAWDDRWLDEADTLPPLDEEEPAPLSAPPADAADDERDELPPALAALLAELAAEDVHLESEDDLQRLLAERPELRARFDAALQDETPPLLRAIDAFVRAPSWAESQQIVEAHPALLEEAAITLFDQIIARKTDEHARQILTERQAPLQRCRTVGVARAFAEQQLSPEGLAESERLGLTPEEFLAAQSAADELPPALREVLAALAAGGIEICSVAELEQALATRPTLRAKLEANSANTDDKLAVLPEFQALIRTAQADEQQYLRRGDRSALEKAAAAWQQILDHPHFLSTPVRFQLSALNNGGSIFLRLYWACGRLDNLNRALVCWQQAVAQTLADVSHLPAILNNLGNGLRARYEHSGRLEDLEQAIGAFQQAVAQTPAGSPTPPAILSSLGIGLSQRYAHSGRLEDLEQAIGAFQQAVAQTLTDAPTLPGYLNNLGNGLMAHYAHSSRLEDLEQAIGVFQQAVAQPPADAPDLPGYLNNLGNGLRARYAHSGRLEDLEQAIAYYEDACRRGLAVAPEETLRSARNWGQWMSEQGNWQAAHHAYGYGLTAVERFFALQLVRADQEHVLRLGQGLAAQGALACAHTGQWEAAVTTMERGRARLLGEALERNRTDLALLPVRGYGELYERYLSIVQRRQQLLQPAENTATGNLDPSRANRLQALETLQRDLNDVIAAIQRLPGYTDFLAKPTFAQIAAVVQGNMTDTAHRASHVDALVYLLTTVQGGLALIVHRGGVEPVWLDVTEAQVREWLVGPAAETQLGGWLGTYQAWLRQRTRATQQAWFDQIESTTRRLWDAIMGPLAAALHSLPTPPPTVTLIPSGLLALLPLHAAWRPHPRPEGDLAPQAGEGTVGGDQSLSPNLGEGPGMGVRYFLDDFAVSYAPSALALRHGQERLTTVATQRVLAIDEPLPVTAGPLPNSGREVAAIVDHFAQPTILAHEQATRPAVLAALADGVDVAHFSCHGGNDWGQPLETALLMADNDPLTVRNLLELHLPGARLASLSACETGLVGTELPDEVVMLPSALLQAGFAGVAASLWSVADVSTAMLMERFYDLWRGEGVAPVHALRQAQQWVRDTTNQEKAAYFATQVPELQPSGATKMAADVAAKFFSAALLHDDGPEARTFAHPFWWAAFTFTGV